MLGGVSVGSPSLRKVLAVKIRLKSGFKHGRHMNRARGYKDRPTSISSRLLRAQDDERRRISRELHDTVGQSLAAVKMNLQRLIASHKFENGINEDIQQCIGVVEQATNEVRTVSYLLHPPTLDIAGLGSAIEWYGEGFAKRSGIQVEVELPANLPRLSMDSETALFRIVQESLTNVHRYAGASNVSIHVSIAQNELRLEVRDDGRGITKNVLRFKQGSKRGVGVGISGMRERLHELDGRLEIRTGNWGTRVTAYLPNLKEQLCDPNPQVFPESPTVVAPAPSVSLKRILIVDDHELMRRGVRDLIEQESDLEICDEASSAAEAIEKILDQNPDLVILDLNMPGGNGWHVIREIRKLGLSTRIVILTAYELETLFYTATAAGCDGVVIKSRASIDLMAAIHAISNGQKFFQRPRPVGR